MPTIDIPVRAMPARTPADLLALARRNLETARTETAGLRYASAHLAALRAAAAVVAARCRPVMTRRAPIPSVWDVLHAVAPEVDTWATYFGGGTTRRAAVEAGIPRAVTAHEADEALRAAHQFVELAALLVDEGV